MKVLTTGYWPGSTRPNQAKPGEQPDKICQLPQVAHSAFEEFKMFYLNRHTGRQLTLQGSMGDADLSAVFYGKKKDETESTEASSTSAPPPKERKHILSVSPFKNSILYCSVGFLTLLNCKRNDFKWIIDYY